MITNHRPGTMSARIIEMLLERPRSTREIAAELGKPLKTASNAVGCLRSGGYIKPMRKKQPRIAETGPHLCVWQIAGEILGDC